MKIFIGQTLFETADQKRFAIATGDWNPIHMDPMTARRTPLGAPIAHGMHTALAGLDFLARHSLNQQNFISKIDIRFPKPVYLNEPVQFSIIRQTDTTINVIAEVKGVTVVEINLTRGKSSIKSISSSPSMPRYFAAAEPENHSFADIESMVGRKDQIDICLSSSELFPDASRWLGSSRIAALATLSTVVGMKCPGLHSLFIGLSMELMAQGPEQQIDFVLHTVDARFRRLELNIAGGGLLGTVSALVRMPPVAQPALADLARRIPSNIFVGQHALIIGGSRGLGESTAKMIAAGGGAVTITYAVGREEAAGLSEEIEAFGGHAEIMPYDVRLPTEPQLKLLKSLPTHLYYFATKTITPRWGSDFDTKLFLDFYRFYVEGFYALCSALHKITPRFKAFYPSSVFVDQRPRGMTEYAMAKAAGELLCADLQKLLPGVTAHPVRLPRMATDQTATHTPSSSGDTFDVIMPILKDMQTSHTNKAP